LHGFDENEAVRTPQHIHLEMRQRLKQARRLGKGQLATIAEQGKQCNV